MAGSGVDPIRYGAGIWLAFQCPTVRSRGKSMRLDHGGSMNRNFNEVPSGNLVNCSGFNISMYALIMRILLFVITSVWIAFYPAYLLLIYMREEGFFSYDVFIEGLFGVNSFLTLILILVVISSIYMWGFIPLIRYAIKNKSTFYAFLSIVFIFVCLVFHITFLEKGFSSENPNRVFWLSILGFILSVFLSTFIGSSIKNIFFNWLIPMGALVISVIVPIFFSDTTSDIVKTGLQNFGVGGGLEVDIYRVEDNEMINSGELLLLAPQQIYLRESNNQYMTISRNSRTYIIVDGY